MVQPAILCRLCPNGLSPPCGPRLPQDPSLSSQLCQRCGGYGSASCLLRLCVLACQCGVRLGPRRCPDRACDTQPSARPVHPRAWTPRSGICSSGSACHPHACARKAAPRRAARACSRTPLFRVNSADAAAVAALPPACSDCACLSVVPDKPRLCTPVVGSLTSEATALTLLRISCHCHFSSLQLTGGSPAIANSALYNSQEVCTLEPHGLVAYIFMHIPLRYRRGRQLNGGRPTNKPAKRPTKKPAHTAANKR